MAHFSIIVLNIPLTCPAAAGLSSPTMLIPYITPLHQEFESISNSQNPEENRELQRLWRSKNFTYIAFLAARQEFVKPFSMRTAIGGALTPVAYVGRSCGQGFERAVGYDNLKVEER